MQGEGEVKLLCECGHIQGWHFRAAGSCLDCLCVEFRWAMDYETWSMFWLITWGAIGEACANPFRPEDVWI